jgi:ABC-type sugar transport system permease subunit
MSMTDSAASVAAPARPPRISRGGRRTGAPRWEFLPWLALPAAVLFFVFGYSMYQLFAQSLTYQGAWAGFDNFSIVLKDPLFRTAVWHNALLLLVVPVLVAVAVGAAILLFETRRGLRGYRAVLFFPFILPIPVVGVVFGQLLQFNGALNQVLRAIGADGLAQDWLGDPNRALWTMAAIIVWKEVGFGIVIVLARLMSLNSEVFEAARVDGASTLKMHLYITLPQLKSVMAFYAINEAIVMVSWVFNYVYVLTNGQGGPGTSTMVSELYIYKTAFTSRAPELASAAAVMLFLVSLVLITAFFRMQRREGGLT